MDFQTSQQRRWFAFAASAVGAGFAVLLSEPVGLLITVAFATICFGWRWGIATAIVISAAAAALIWVEGDLANLSIRGWTAYAISAFGIWAVITSYRTISFYDQVYKTVRPTLEDIPGLGWSAYPDGRMRFVNPAATEFVGITPEEMKERMEGTDTAWWTPFVHPDDRERSLALWRNSLKTGEPIVDEQRVRRFDGTYRWFRDSAIASRDENGKITAWYGSTVDITDQKNAEAALKASEQQLRELINTVPALIWRAGPDGKTNYVNDQLIRWFGLSAGERDVGGLESLLMDAVHPEERQEIRATVSRLFATRKSFCLKYRHRRSDGSYRWTNATVQPLLDIEGAIVQWYGVFLDINDEIEALNALRRSETETRLIVDTVPSLIWLMSTEGFVFHFNDRMVEWTGIEPGPSPSNPSAPRPTYSELIHPDDSRRIAEEFKNALETGTALHTKGRLLRKDGQFRWLDSRVEPLRDDTGNIIRWYGVSIDIEEEVRAQAALRESERYLQHMIDTVPVGIVLSDNSGTPVYVNKRLVDNNGLYVSRKSEGSRLDISPAVEDLVHPDDRETVENRWALARRKGKPYAMRYRQRRADGVYRWIEDRSEPFRDDGGKILQWYGVNLDIDDEVKAQEALRIADERLAKAARTVSLSELSISIAHDLNQPLQGVVSNVTAFKNWLRATPPNLERATRTAEWIVRDVEAAAEVVSRIRTIFSQTEHKREAVSLKAVIEDVKSSLADKLIAGKIKVHVDLDGDLPDTLADRVQIEQVVLNLLKNSVEAFDETRSRSRSIEVRARKVNSEVVEVSVGDNGPGLTDPEKVFEAFYTTKSDALGIGLAICRSIVEAHGGQLSAGNRGRGGALVAFTLPTNGRAGIGAAGSDVVDIATLERGELQ
ncbi:PAS domain S-box protein (plasmid) [Agrobacterium sp. 33MFTa1.1]|uniref:PAS domain-containing sensor histidine kinase n=1 Tax=Agrobacterium sp. 33MFTa1.1 TaxID=1279031 RepID=UPI000690D1C5|nr:PAS domain-containing protein [Agrobacterium sp. 33MFTa1.1]QBJ16801.1 PAS domain S-box protein [Agrobacterium sp. 33MFTa1.1]